MLWSRFVGSGWCESYVNCYYRDGGCYVGSVFLFFFCVLLFGSNWYVSRLVSISV